MKAGNIKLFSREGSCLDSKRYDNVTRRKSIILGWKLVFPNFHNHYYQISPDIKTTKNE
jgi:hypothetical protein